MSEWFFLNEISVFDMKTLIILRNSEKREVSGDYLKKFDRLGNG